MFNWSTTSSRPPFHFVSRFELSTRFIKKPFLVHWWCVYYNQPTSTPLNRRFDCPLRPGLRPWWTLVGRRWMTLVMVSLFDQFVPFSSFEWKAKIWIGSHLILQYNFSRKTAISATNEKTEISRFLELWLDDENSQFQCWKIESAPVTSPDSLTFE